MALERVAVAVPLGKGIDQKTDPHLVIPPNATRLENWLLDKLGALRKRNGYDAFTAPGNGVRNYFFDHQGALAAISKRGTYLFSEVRNAWRHVTGLGASPTNFRARSLTRSTEALNNFDVAIVGDFIVTTWAGEDLTQYYQVQELVSEALVVPPTSFATTVAAQSAKVVGMGGRYAVFLYVASGGTNLTQRTLDTQTMTLSSPTNLKTLGTTPRFDISVGNTLDGSATIAAMITSDATETRVYDVRISGGAATINAQLGSLTGDYLGSVAVAAYYDARVTRWFFLAFAGGASAFVFSTADFVSATSANDILTTSDYNNDARMAIAIGSQSNHLVAAIGYVNDDGGYFTRFQRIENSIINKVSGEIAVPNVALASTGAQLSGSLSTVFGLSMEYGNAFLGTNSTWKEPGCLLASPYNGAGAWLSSNRLHVHGRYFGDLAWKRGDSNRQLGKLVCTSERAILVQTVRTAGNVDNTVFSGGNILYVSTAPNTLTFDRANGLTIHNGGVVCAFDGTTSFENAIHTSPKKPTVSIAASGGVPAGTYQYCVVYQFTDTAGNIHRSAPSPASAEYVHAGGKDVNVDYYLPPPTSISEFYGKELQVSLWRSGDPDGTPDGNFYLAAIDSVTAHPTAAHLGRITDSNTGDLVGNEALYTNGGVLENLAPPALRHLRVAKDRVIGISAEARNVAVFSKTLQPGVAPEFSGENLSVTFPDDGGELTAIAVPDDKIVVFAERGAYYFFGDGPNNTLTEGGFFTPIPIRGSVGCVNPASVIETPMGVLFQSERGIHLLDVKGMFHYIGAAVEDEVNSSTIRKAVLLPEKGQVRYITSAHTLVYDFTADAWAVFKYGADGDQIAEDAILWNGHYTWFDSTYAPCRESNDYLDGTEDYTTVYESPWLTPDGVLAGFHRFWRLFVSGRYAGGGSITVEVGYDRETTYPTSRTWTEAELLSLTATRPLELEVHIDRQKASAIRFRITHSFDTAAGVAGLTLTGITLTMGSMTSAHKLGAENKK